LKEPTNRRHPIDLHLSILFPRQTSGRRSRCACMFTTDICMCVFYVYKCMSTRAYMFLRHSIGQKVDMARDNPRLSIQHVLHFQELGAHVLQCVAVCCSVLQCVAVRCSALQCVAVRCSALQCVAFVNICINRFKVCSNLNSSVHTSCDPYVHYHCFICVACLMHTCGMTHSYVSRDSFIRKERERA